MASKSATQEEIALAASDFGIRLMDRLMDANYHQSHGGPDLPSPDKLAYLNFNDARGKSVTVSVDWYPARTTYDGATMAQSNEVYLGFGSIPLKSMRARWFTEKWDTKAASFVAGYDDICVRMDAAYQAEVSRQKLAREQSQAAARQAKETSEARRAQIQSDYEQRLPSVIEAARQRSVTTLQ